MECFFNENYEYPIIRMKNIRNRLTFCCSKHRFKMRPIVQRITREPPKSYLSVDGQFNVQLVLVWTLPGQDSIEVIWWFDRKYAWIRFYELAMSKMFASVNPSNKAGLLFHNWFCFFVFEPFLLCFSCARVCIIRGHILRVLLPLYGKITHKWNNNHYLLGCQYT